MSTPAAAVFGAVVAAVVFTAVSQAAPLVLGDGAMSQVRMSYRLVQPGVIRAEGRSETGSSSAVLSPSGLSARVSAASMRSPTLAFGPAARLDPAELTASHPRAGDGVVVLLDQVPVPKPQGKSSRYEGALTRLLCDTEADQVTAAGFLFPVAAAISTRTVIAGPAIVFAPVAQTKTMTRNVVVVPRPSESMIVDIGRM